MKNVTGSLKFIFGVLILTVFSVSAVYAAPVKIGVILPLTGQMAAYGEDGRRAIELARDELNAAGGINGEPVEIIFEDSGGTPKGSTAATLKLIEIDKVVALAGGLFSSEILAMKPILNQHKIVLMTPMASNPRLYEDTRFLFSMTPTDHNQTWLNSKYYIQVVGIKTLGSLYMNTDNGIDSDALLTKYWEQFGGKVLVHESFNPGSTDFRTQLTKIKAANPEFLYINATWKEAVKIFQQISEMNIKMRLGGNSQIREQKLIEMAGSAVEGVTLTDQTSLEGWSTEDKALRDKFEKGFNDRFKTPPAIVAYKAYDMMRALFAGIKIGGIKGEELRNAIVKLNIPGVVGAIRFRESGAPIKESAMLIIKDGKFVELNYSGIAPSE